MSDKIQINFEVINQDTYKDFTLKQVHSNIAIFRNEENMHKVFEADGHVTNIIGLNLKILTADCVPILFWDDKSTTVAAAHAGWRGVLTGIIDSTLDLIQEYSTHNLSAMLGPSIQQKSYEVGAEIYDLFVQKNTINTQFFTPLNGKFLFDLPGCVEMLLKARDVSVFNTKEDTYTSICYPSYRREVHSKTSTRNRILSSIMIKNEQ